jgi:hypothetical protein
MRDAVRVDGIIAAADAGAGDTPPPGPGVMPSAPPAAHRKAVAGKREQATELVASDFDLQYPTAELRRPPVAPVTWTPDEGFVEEQEAEPAASMTMFRKRSPVQPVGGAEPTEEILEDEHPGIRFVPAEGPRRVAPPRDLVDLVEQATGIHVGDAIIDRSPQVSERAAELGAIAFTERGTVHLPAELGDIDRPEVRAAAAHELVHVAQHRIAQGELPHEDSPEGQRLEGAARAVQRSLAPGAPVVPAFIRSGANLPAHRTQGPVGVQRLANEGTGEDFSDLDLSLIEPGGGDDRFLWQEREGEPTGVPWDERRRWDELFETQHSTTLQGKRDVRHEQLLNSVVGDAQPTREQMLEVRRQLDLEMPYQFGPPFGIEPYSQLLPGETGRAGDAGGGAGGGGGGGGTGVAALAVGARALTATAPVATAAETGRANEALRHIAAQAHEHHRLRGDHEGSLVELIDERYELERAMRWEVLAAMRDAAQQEGATPDHVVALSDDQIARIRAAVDVEIPLDVPYPQYLENEVMRVSLAGEIDGPLPAGGTAGGRTTGTGVPPASATGGMPGTTGAGTPPTTTPSAGAGDAQSALAGILQNAREDAGRAATGELSGRDWLQIYQVRFDYEKALRDQVLRAKLEGAVHAGSEVGMMVRLEQHELDQIHQAVDLAHPVNLDRPSYLDSDEFLSHQISDEDVATYGRQVPPATQAAAAPASETAPAAAPAAATAPGGTTAAGATADAGTSDVPAGGAAPAQSHSAGAVSLATGLAGLLGAMHQGDDHAGDELAGTVVDSLTEVDIEMLSRRLWERLRRELRTELLIDRERAGALADIR